MTAQSGRSRTLGGALVVAIGCGCGLANPVLRSQDGEPPVRLRAGIASMAFDDECNVEAQCTVQLSLGHLAVSTQHVEVVAVNLVASGVPLGAIPIDDVLVWRSGAYRPWDGRVPWGGSTRLSIELGRIDWTRVLAPLVPQLDPTRHMIAVEVMLRSHGHDMPVRSIFAVRPTAGATTRIVIT